MITDLKHGDPKFRINDTALPTNIASILRYQVNSSTDPQLLSSVGTILTQLGDNQIVQAGLPLLQKAINLDPGNPKWREAFASAKAEPIRRRNRAALAHAGK